MSFSNVPGPQNSAPQGYVQQPIQQQQKNNSKGLVIAGRVLGAIGAIGLFYFLYQYAFVGTAEEQVESEGFGNFLPMVISAAVFVFGFWLARRGLNKGPGQMR